MTIESVRAHIDDDISKLPKGHPDIPFLRAQFFVFSAYLDAHAQPVDAAKSTDVIEPLEGETRANYLRRTYQVLSLKGFQDLPLSTFNQDPITNETAPTIKNAFEFLRWYERSSDVRSHRFNNLATNITITYIQNERDILEQTGLSDLEKTPIRKLGLPKRAINCLRRETGEYRNSGEHHYLPWSRLVVNNNQHHLPSVEEAGTLTMRTRDELSDLRNLGKWTLDEIEEKLSRLGLSLASPATDQPLDPKI